MEGNLLEISKLDEAISTVSNLYCPHKVTPTEPVRSVKTRFGVLRGGDQPAVYVSYSAPVIVDAGCFPNLLLMMSASAGAARVTQNQRTASWHAGQTIPMSPGQETILEFNGQFAQTSLRVNVDRAEAMCAQWLGYPLPKPLRFDLQPLQTNFEKIWQDTMRVVLTLGASTNRLEPNVSESLDDFLLSLMLTRHPHTFSEELAKPVRAVPSRLVAAAEQLLRERANSKVVMSEIADELGVNIRSLQLGFRESKQTTPSAYLLKIRLDAAHRTLATGGPSATVIDVALKCGFTHVGRFSAAYKAAFGETPCVTLRRSRLR